LRSVVVDTNVLAYFLLGVEPHGAGLAGRLRRCGMVMAPDLWRPELLNVLSMAVRTGRIDPASAFELIGASEGVVDRTVSSADLAETALALALERGHAVYDTLFVALAVRDECPLWTYDRAILKRFPEVAVCPTSP